MEHIAALLLIIGCSEDLSQCRELPAPVPVYETMEECDAELPYSFGEFMKSYPQLMARCVEVDPALEETDAELVWDITADGHLVASVEPVEHDQPDQPAIVVAREQNRNELGTIRLR